MKVENECLDNFKDGPFMWPASKIQVFDHPEAYDCILNFTVGNGS